MLLSLTIDEVGLLTHTQEIMEQEVEAPFTQLHEVDKELHVKYGEQILDLAVPLITSTIVNHPITTNKGSTSDSVQTKDPS